MTNEQLPKFVLKKINQKRAEQGLCTYEEEEKKRKKKDGKPVCDVRLLYYFLTFVLIFYCFTSTCLWYTLDKMHGAASFVNILSSNVAFYLL